MFTTLFETKNKQKEPQHKEGDLYKIVTIFGKTFKLRYGYYDELDRQSTLCDPIVIYPDFVENPLYTDQGEPFITKMQDVCKYYKSQVKKTLDSTCADCKYYGLGEDWIGICTCSKNKAPTN